MTDFVVDASVAVKWVVEEDGTQEALALKGRSRLIAPDLLVAECANILWKKVRLRELSKAEALIAARLIQGAEIELMATLPLLESATRIAIELDHPAYDCLYLALALAHDCQFVTADKILLRRLGEGRRGRFGGLAASLNDAR